MAEILFIGLTKKLQTLECMVSQFPGKQQNVNVTYGKPDECVVFIWNQFFSDKINLKKVSKPFISLRYTNNFGAKALFFHINSLHIAFV